MIYDALLQLHRAYKQQKYVFIFCMGFFLSFLVPFDGLAAEFHMPQYCTEVSTEDENKYLEELQKGLREGEFLESYDRVKEEYHNEVNDYFNEIFAVHMKPFSQFKNRDNCTAEPDDIFTTTPVISQSTLDNLRKYECALLVFVKDPPLLGNEKTLYQGVGTKAFIQEMLRLEIDQSYDALEQMIPLYNEMRTLYPVHRDLECLIGQMEEYRNALRGFVDEIVWLPAKFYNYGSRHQE